jgi:hypothetical protein
VNYSFLVGLDARGEELGVLGAFGGRGRKPVGALGDVGARGSELGALGAIGA